MKINHGLITVSFYILQFYSSVFSQEIDTEPWLPAQNQTVNCPQYQNCDEISCHFNGMFTGTFDKHFLLGDGSWVMCGSLRVNTIVPVSSGSDVVGNKTYSCFEYVNGNGTSFPVAEVILSKPVDVNGSQITCTFDGKNCTQQNETGTQVVLVAGFPNSCTPWVPPTIPPLDSEPWLPAQNQTVNCPQYQNCDEITCYFNGTFIETSFNHYVLGDGSWLMCGSLRVDILVPVSSDSDDVGNKTYSCFEYVNGNGTIFHVAEVILTKPVDVNGSQITCTFDENKCTQQNETDTQIVLVAGFPNSCTPWVPPTTPPPETTTAPSTTEMTTESNTTESEEPSTTVSSETAGPDITTGAGTETPSAEPASSTQAAGASTTSLPVETTTSKGDLSGARLEFAAVLAVVVSFFIQRYM